MAIYAQARRLKPLSCGYAKMSVVVQRDVGEGLQRERGRALARMTSRSPRSRRVRFDAFQNVVHTVDILEVEQRGGAVKNWSGVRLPDRS